MQLKVEDLRLGNAFLQKGSNFVEFATVGDLVRIHEGCIIAEPIPLTEDWLVKFGGIDNVYTIEIGQLKFTWASRIIATGERCSWSCEQYLHIQYVHQLQNLYYALTNQELTCK